MTRKRAAPLDNTDFIVKIIMAVGGAVGILVVAIVRFFVKHGESKKSKPPPAPPTPPAPPPPILRAVPDLNPPGPSHDFLHTLRSIEKGVEALLSLAREREKEDAKEGVHDAETRRLIADIASAMQALAIQIDHDRAGWRRENDDNREALRVIREHLRDLTTDLRRIENTTGR